MVPRPRHVRLVDRCNYCPAVADQKRADELAAERARIDALPPNPSMADIYRAAAARTR